MNKRGLVLSGGGKKGVFPLSHIEKTGKKYTHINGVSTGILAGAMIAAGRTRQAIEVYVNMSNKLIYSYSPFNSKGQISIPKVLYRILSGKTSLGELHNLRNLIEDNFTYSDFLRVKEQGIEITCYAHNIQKKSFPLEAYSNLEVDYFTFVDAMVASCCFWPFGHVAKVLGQEHVDGGHAESITIRQMIKKGVQDIDVYVLQERLPQGSFPPIKNFWDALGRVLRGMREYSYWNNFEAACELAAELRELTINCIYLPRETDNNAMNFNAAHAREYEAMGADLELVKKHTQSF